jgi:hypothetical protein
VTDLTAIRVALAANLRTVPDCQVSPWLLASPASPSLQVVGPREFEPTTFGDHHSILMVVEGCVPGVLDRGSFEKFDAWITGATDEQDVWAAIESDDSLTKRLLDNGTVQTGQTAVADSVAVERFNGYTRTTLLNQTEALVGEWEVRVLT